MSRVFISCDFVVIYLEGKKGIYISSYQMLVYKPPASELSGEFKIQASTPCSVPSSQRSDSALGSVCLKASKDIVVGCRMWESLVKIVSQKPMTGVISRNSIDRTEDSKLANVLFICSQPNQPEFRDSLKLKYKHS